jgi:hypothetical protein
MEGGIIGSKSCSLPKREILEGQEHATKADLDHSEGQLDKIFMVINTVSWGQLNPMEQVHILLLTSSDQRLVKGSSNKHIQQDVGSTPKNIMYYQESTTRLPKGSNSYGDGGLILGTCPRMQASTKVTQFSRSFMVSAGNGETNEMKLEIPFSDKEINLYKLICTESLLIRSYKNLLSKGAKSSMTSGDGLT